MGYSMGANKNKNFSKAKPFEIMLDAKSSINLRKSNRITIDGKLHRIQRIDSITSDGSFMIVSGRSQIVPPNTKVWKRGESK